MSERYFAAVLAPASVHDQIEQWVVPRRDQVWRWSDSSGWHITVAFYERVEPWRYPMLTENLAAAAARSASIRLRIDGVGVFPSPSAARVLYAQVSADTEELAILAGHCRTAATRVGIAVPRRRYQPHLTLARSRRPVSAIRHLRALSGLSSDGWVVTELVLVQSFLAEGPRYQVVARFPLANLAEG